MDVLVERNSGQITVLDLSDHTTRCSLSVRGPGDRSQTDRRATTRPRDTLGRGAAIPVQYVSSKELRESVSSQRGRLLMQATLVVLLLSLIGPGWGPRFRARPARSRTSSPSRRRNEPCFARKRCRRDHRGRSRSCRRRATADRTRCCHGRSRNGGRGPL